MRIVITAAPGSGSSRNRLAVQREDTVGSPGLSPWGGADMKVLIKSAWGSDESTKAAFAFLHANAFAEAGHEVQIFLLGEAVNLMKKELINAVTPVGWPPLSEIISKTIEYKIPINV